MLSTVLSRCAPQIEEAVDEVCAQGYKNLFFIGCGGTYAHSLPMKYWMDTVSTKMEMYPVIAAEFYANVGTKRFPVIPCACFPHAAATRRKLLKPLSSARKREHAQLCMYLTTILLSASMRIISSSALPKTTAYVKRFIHIPSRCFPRPFLKNAGEFDKYDEFMAQYEQITPYLIKAKEQYEETLCQDGKRLQRYRVPHGCWVRYAVG